MFDKFERMDSSEGNVWKYIFESKTAIAEAVLYRYDSFEQRTVICCSVQSGCPVGCLFCGTGKRFIRNLDSAEILQQISIILQNQNITDINDKCNKFQIMFMSMGEPMLNWQNTETAIQILNLRYPNAELLVSTIGVNDDPVFSKIIYASKQLQKLGLQFSIHKSNDNDRNILIPFKNKMPLVKIRDAGIVWWKETGRKPYLNYCVDGTNNSFIDFFNLSTMFSPVVFNITFSVVCSADENMKEKGFKNLNSIEQFSQYFIESGYNTRVFNPAGQDDIGGGCGQLWYVQEWMKNNVKK